jgi:parallel beta-helix repeat protein
MIAAAAAPAPQSLRAQIGMAKSGDPSYLRTQYEGLRIDSPARNNAGRAAPAIACAEPQPDAAHTLVIDPYVWSKPTVSIEGGPALKQAIETLPSTGTRTIYLRSGRYAFDKPLVLTSAANGLSIMACPGETPVIEGRDEQPSIILRNTQHVMLEGLTFTGPGSGLVMQDGTQASAIHRNTFLQANTAVLLDHASRNLISENLILRSGQTGIEMKNDSDNNIVEDNIIDGTNAPETFGGGVFLHTAKANRVSHNTIRHTLGFGIGVMNWDDKTINVDNIIEYNLIRDTATTSQDSGAIYILGRSGVDTGVVIAGNIIDGVGGPTQHAVGIYLDDSTNGATVVYNIVRGAGSDSVQIHGGSDNFVSNNILDLGRDRTSAVLFQAAPADTNPLNAQTGNVVTQNIIMSTNSQPKQFVWFDGGRPTVSKNLYTSSNSMLPLSDGPVIDRAPVQADPALAADGPEDGYRSVQAAAALAIGFRYVDTARVGARRNR